jgi:hypothetical protein
MYRLFLLKHLGIVTLLLPFFFVISSHRSSSTTVVNTLQLYDYNKSNIRNILAQNKATTTRQKRTALIIGNAEYQEVGRLKNPINDANDIAKSLRELGFEVTLLTDASLQKMEQAIENYNRQLRQGGVGLFYFSGHGVQAEGENYLVPVEAKLERGQDVRYEAYPVGKLLGAIEDARNKANIIILDACRNNPFTRSWRSSSRGLAAPAQTAQGVLVAYSTAPGKVAFDGKGRNSPYTSAILRHIQTPGLDVEQMFKSVRGEVLKETEGKQIPWESSSLIGKFAFNLTNDGKTNEVATSVSKPTLPPVTTPSPTSTTTNNSVRTAYFRQPPLFDYLGASSNSIRIPSATYYFTINLPENAQTPLQQVKIKQRSGLETIDFNLKKTVAHEGKRRQKEQKIQIKDVTRDSKTKTVSVIFDPPISPGKSITIALRAVQNPSSTGIYEFEVMAFPLGDKSRAQNLGVKRLSFYRGL